MSAFADAVHVATLFASLCRRWLMMPMSRHYFDTLFSPLLIRLLCEYTFSLILLMLAAQDARRARHMPMPVKMREDAVCSLICCPADLHATTPTVNATDVRRREQRRHTPTIVDG